VKSKRSKVGDRGFQVAQKNQEREKAKLEGGPSIDKQNQEHSIEEDKCWNDS